MTKEPKALICPFCGTLQRAGDSCAGCGTPLDGETRRQTLARMGPWYLRSESQPFMPGCSWDQIAAFASAGVVTRDSILRGPTTRQLWTLARRVQGVAHLLGVCHACQAKVTPTSAACPACRASFGAPLDRNQLGIPTDEEKTHAHLDAPGAAPLSAFATNDELREGLHEETRRRRSLGSAGLTPLTDHATHPRASDGGPLGLGSDHSARRRLPPWLIIGGPVAIVAMVVIVAGGLALASSERTAPAHGSSAEMTAAPAPALDAASDAQGGAPTIDHAPAPLPVPPAPTTSTPTTATPSTATPPTATPAPAAPVVVVDLFAPVDAQLRRARDGALSRADRGRAIDEATRLLDELAAITAPSLDPTQLGLRRSAISSERDRLAAEVFLRGEGEAK